MWDCGRITLYLPWCQHPGGQSVGKLAGNMCLEEAPQISPLGKGSGCKRSPGAKLQGERGALMALVDSLPMTRAQPAHPCTRSLLGVAARACLMAGAPRKGQHTWKPVEDDQVPARKIPGNGMGEDTGRSRGPGLTWILPTPHTNSRKLWVSWDWVSVAQWSILGPAWESFGPVHYRWEAADLKSPSGELSEPRASQACEGMPRMALQYWPGASWPRALVTSGSTCDVKPCGKWADNASRSAEVKHWTWQVLLPFPLHHSTCLSYSFVHLLFC